MHLKILLFFLFLSGFSSFLMANVEGLIDENIKIDHAKEIFTDLTHISPPENDSAIRSVYQSERLLGYIFYSTDFTQLVGYSGEQIKLLIGLDPNGKFMGVKLIKHSEPIFLHGMSEDRLFQFVRQYANRSIFEQIVVNRRQNKDIGKIDSGPIYIDGISRATVTVMAMNNIVLDAAVKAARKKIEGFSQQTLARLNTTLYEPLNWQELINRGYVNEWEISLSQIEAKLGKPVASYPRQPEDLVKNVKSIKLYYGYLNAPIIGKNLIGEGDYKRLLERLDFNEHAFFVTSDGALSHTVSNFTPGTAPDRLAIVQNNIPLRIQDSNFYNFLPRALAAGIPNADQANIYLATSHVGISLQEKFQFQFKLALQRNALFQDSATVNDNFTLPTELFESSLESNRNQPLWKSIWVERKVEIVILLIALFFLTVLFLNQKRINTRMLVYLRWSFVLFTLVFIGIIAQGQLSVVNIFTVLSSLLQGFRIDVFLLDPILFILWSYTFISLFILGRGLFCGWLCPFGALQSLIAKLAGLLSIRQIKISDKLHSRLIKFKYVILAVLVITSLVSMQQAEMLAEIEPFKTTFTLFFSHSYPFVLYALIILGAGLFVHKFYCRYICPLGAGLAIIGRLRRVESLTRIDKCGSPCQFCSRKCNIRAIGVNGEIDYNECNQCLECAVILKDSNRCVDEILINKMQKRLQKKMPASGLTPSNEIL